MVVVPGLYEALLELERERCNDPRYIDPRWKKLRHPGGGYCGNPGVVCEHDPPPVKYRRSRHLLEALEAGRPVVVPNLLHGHSLRHLDVSVPWKTTQVRFLRVSPDDLVQPGSPLRTSS